MELPEKLLLAKIETQNAYFDKKSKEESTNMIKRKYKLTGNIFPAFNIYTFFVLTSNKDSCQRFLTIEIYCQDWEDREAKHLTASVSYIDIKRVEVMGKIDLLNKKRDIENGFLYVGRLSNEKYKKLQELRSKVPKTVPKHTKDFIDLALIETEGDTVDTILKKLGLS